MPCRNEKNHSADADRVKSIYKVMIAGSIINVVLLVLKFVAGILRTFCSHDMDAIHSLHRFCHRCGGTGIR